jgi:hypothetical protein
MSTYEQGIPHLKGAKLGNPSSEIEETNAMGRGTMPLTISS